MNREVPVRFSEGLVVRFRWAAQLWLAADATKGEGRARRVAPSTLCQRLIQRAMFPTAHRSSGLPAPCRARNPMGAGKGADHEAAMLA